MLELLSAKLCISSATHVDNLKGTSRHVTKLQEGRWQDTDMVEWKRNVGSNGLQIADDSHGPPKLLNIGKNLDLKISSWGVSIYGRRHTPFKVPLYPSFTSKHVSHAHQLKWKLTVSCAGKERKITGSAAITILGPSERDEGRRALSIAADGALQAHRQWADGAVDTPMLAHGVVFMEQPPGYTSPPAEDSHTANVHKT